MHVVWKMNGMGWDEYLQPTMKLMPDAAWKVAAAIVSRVRLWIKLAYVEFYWRL